MVKIRYHLEMIEREARLVVRRCEARKLDLAGSLIRTISHLTRKIRHCHDISMKSKGSFHLLYRFFQWFQLHRAVRERKLARKKRLRRRARHEHAALRRAHRPVHLGGEHGQQGEVGIVERDVEADLLVVRERVIRSRRERPQRHDAARARTVGMRLLLADGLSHLHLVDIQDAVRETQPRCEIVKRRALDTAVFRLHGHARRWARERIAERHIDVCRAEHICPYACRFREHAERYVAALHARGNRPIQGYRAVRRKDAGCSLRPLALLDGEHAIRELELQREVMHLIARDLPLGHRTLEIHLRIVRRALQHRRGIERAAQDIVLLVEERCKTLYIGVLHDDIACERAALRVEREVEVVAAIPLQEAETVKLHDMIRVARMTVGARDGNRIEDEILGIKRPIEYGILDAARHRAVERAVPRYLIGQLVLDALHVDVANLRLEIQAAIQPDRAVQHGVDERRIDMEHLQAQHIVLDEIVAVHAG